MARVTVEDCIQKVENRFELVMVASQRARQIGTGAPLLLDRDNDKNPVVSLREIAEDKILPSDMKEELIRNHQRVLEMDDTEDVIDMMEGEEEWSAIAAAQTAAIDADDDSDDSDEPEDDGYTGESSLEDLAGGAPQED